MKSVQKCLWLLMTTCLLLAYQNCVPSSPMSFSNGSSKASNQENAPETEGGDGQPFDGKVYVLEGEVCPDQTNIQAKILLKTFTSATLVREKCRDITPVLLTANDFQLNPSNSEQMNYQNQLFTSVKPTQIIGTQLDLTTLTSDTGFAYRLQRSFGTAADISNGVPVSKLRLYEDGVLMGPAHSTHTDVRNLGRSRFSHWDESFGQDPATGESLRFSASDNTDPRTNGRVYSFDIAP